MLLRDRGRKFALAAARRPGQIPSHSSHGAMAWPRSGQLADALHDCYVLERELGRGGMATAISPATSSATDRLR